ncbi:cytochrome c [Nitrospiraceae bacterium AH_259_D15_M11_P09]|nr:cytochrome c [Nitrospiraceae bacterium AH_259_D15_M11_P09]
MLPSCKIRTADASVRGVRTSISRPSLLTPIPEWYFLFYYVVFTFLFISLRTVVKMPVTDPSVVRGKQLYQTLGCAACHRIHGEGEMIGPELSSVVRPAGR